MAVVNLNWSKNAIAAIGPSGQNNFTNAREAEESTSSDVNVVGTNEKASSNIRSSSRGGASFGFARSYYGFDFTGYTTGTITNLAFHFKPTTSSTATLSNRLAQFTGFGEEVGSNYNDGDWWDSIADPLVPYSNAFNITDGTTAASVTLNSTALTDAKADGFLKLVLMIIGDYNNLNIAVDVSNASFLNQSSNNTFLRFDYAAPGYGNTVIGVGGSSIVTVNNVTSADIVSVIGAE